MKTYLAFFALLLSVSSFNTYGQTAYQEGAMENKSFNFSSFLELNTKNITSELDSLTPENFKHHPEYGVLPYYAPCSECVELIHKRTDSTRYFIKNGSGGTEFIHQSSYKTLHYKDEQGNLRENLAFVFPTNHPQIFKTNHQKEVVSFNLMRECVDIEDVEGRSLLINNKLELWAIDQNELPVKLSNATWSAASVGKDGLLVKNIFPNIDLEVLSSINGLKTTFIVKNNQANYGQYKYIFIKDQLFENQVSDFRFTANASPNGYFNSDVLLYNSSNELLGKVAQGVVFDDSRNLYANLFYAVDNGFNMLLDADIFSNPNTQFPVYIDPLVTTTSTLAQANITGSGYSAVCFTNSCNYNLAVTFPANAVFTGVTFSMSYLASGFLCYMSDGAMRVATGNCISPNQNGFFWFCNTAGGGTCTGTNMNIYPEVNTCLPAPSCNTQTQNFTLQFFRCYGAGTGCSNTCISAASPFIVNVEGRTLEANGITNSTTSTICEGASATLTAGSGQYGVAPYTYTWSPGGQTTQSITVTPTTTTTYSVVTRDACNQTITTSYTLTVNTNNNPGFTINPNPACVGQGITMASNGTGTAYNWQTPSANIATQNGAHTVTRTYASPGTYNVTMTTTNGSCSFPVTQQVTISNAVNPTASITAAPTGPICAGTTVTFTATGTGITTAATYQWYVNNNPIAGATNATYTANNLPNGAQVHVVINPNNPCAASAAVTSNVITITVTPPVTPSVSITSNPTTGICAGSAISFTANPTNGGTAPTYQWMVNGSPVAGATGATFTSSTLNNNDVVSVVMTSNATCTSSPTATSNTINVIVNPVVTPSVTIVMSPATGICAGSPITFTATPTNGGTAPTYQWLVNGNPVAGVAGATFTSSTLQNGDVVSVVLTSNASCLSAPTATSNSLNITTTNNVTPSVTITNTPTGTNCAGTSITFTANPTNGGTAPTYQWLVNGNPVAGATGATFTSNSLNNGDVVTVILNSSVTCVVNNPATSNAITMSVSPGVTPSVAINVTPTGPYCAGDVLQFTSTSNNEGSNPTYQWLINGTPIPGENGTTYTHTVGNNGDVISLGLISDAVCVVNPNAVSNAVTMDVFQPVSVALGPDLTICEGQQAVINYQIIGNATPFTYNWTPTPLAASPAVLTPFATTTFSLMVTDQCNNVATDDVTVNVMPLPIASFTYSPTEISLGNQPVVFTNTSTNGDTYEWIFGDGGLSTDENTSHKYVTPGDFVVRLTVTSADGCKSSVDVIINIDNDYTVYIPNSFTPNEDKLNTYFEPKGVAFQQFLMVIFDRWGNVIYDNTELQNISGVKLGWDGYHQGKPAPQGTYVYRIEVQNPSKEDPDIFVGNVNLFR